MNDETKNDMLLELLDFFRVLADVDRLKIVGMLAIEKATIEELAEKTNLPPSDVFNHVYKLTNAELLRSVLIDEKTYYEVASESIERKARDIFSKEKTSKIPEEMDLEVFDRKVIEDYMTEDGRLKRFPAKYKKLKSILRFVVKSFEFDKGYSEVEVNAILKEFNEDFASLRRELVDSKFMRREGGGGQYWRNE